MKLKNIYFAAERSFFGERSFAEESNFERFFAFEVRSFGFSCQCRSRLRGSSWKLHWKAFEPHTVQHTRILFDLFWYQMSYCLWVRIEEHPNFGWLWKLQRWSAAVHDLNHIRRFIWFETQRNLSEPRITAINFFFLSSSTSELRSPFILRSSCQPQVWVCVNLKVSIFWAWKNALGTAKRILLVNLNKVYECILLNFINESRKPRISIFPSKLISCV